MLKHYNILCFTVSTESRRAATLSVDKGAAGNKTSNKYLRYYSTVEAHEDSLP